MRIIGHQKQLFFLKKIVESGKVPHALLFCGQEKLGKKTIALEFISWLFSETSLNHPDFILITPPEKQSEEEPNSLQGNSAPTSASLHRQIQINQIRDLNWRLSLKPIKAKILVAIIDQAHLMTEEAQNCFLKTLEEPKTNSLLILITEHPNYLLPTIASRCEVIKFYPVKKKEIEDFLKEKGLAKEEITEITEASLGRPGIAIDLLENSEKLKERKQKIKELIKISNSPISLRFQYAKELSQNQNIKEILNIWLEYFRKLLISTMDKVSLEKMREIENILKNLQRTIFLLSTTNVNSCLALKILLMDF